MTKTAKNGSLAGGATTPGGNGSGGGVSAGGGTATSVSGGAPHSVGSAKSEPSGGDPLDTSVASDGAGGGGTPASLHAVHLGSEPDSVGAGSVSTPKDGGGDDVTLNGGDGLLCDSGGGGAPNATDNADTSDGGSDLVNAAPSSVGPGSVGAHSKASTQEDIKPPTSNCSTPQQGSASGTAPNMEDNFLEGFDTKDGGKHLILGAT